MRVRKRTPNRLLWLIAAVLLTFTVAGHAQHTVLEVITLKYRSADQIIPMLKPLLAPGGTISGMQNRVVVRTTPQNLAELRKVLDAVDSAPRRLVISVRQEAAGSGIISQAEISGSVGGERARATVPGGGGDRGATIEANRGDDRVSARVLRSRSDLTGSNVQTVQVLEGGEAFIRVGQSVPVRNRTVVRTPQGTQIAESVEYRNADTGFYVSPRVNGDQVTLMISARRDSVADPNTGAFNVQRVETVVSGRLGEWIELAGIGEESVQSDSGTVYRRSGSVADDRTVLLKVDEIR